MEKETLVAILGYSAILVLVGFATGSIWTSFDIEAMQETICSNTQTQTMDYRTCKQMDMQDIIEQIPAFTIQKK